MGIRAKTFVTLAVLFALSFGALGAVLASRIAGAFAEIEAREARRNLDRVREGVGGAAAAVCAKVSDWAIWDDAHAFMADGNAEFLASNLVEATFTGMGIDLMLFRSGDGTIRHVQAYTPEEKLAAPVPAALVEGRLGAGSALLAGATADAPRSGVIAGAGPWPAVYCAMPILTSDGEGPARGTLVFAAWLGPDRQAAIAKATRLDLAFAQGPGPAGPDALAPEDDGILVGSTALADAGGEGALTVTARLPREVHREARRTIFSVFVALAVVGLLFGGAIWALLEVLVLRRVKRMSDELHGLTETFDFGRRVDGSGRDEIGRLGDAVNGLVAAMEQATTAAAPAGKGGPSWV
jgi:sensor domain CHASE-containing protein